MMEKRIVIRGRVKFKSSFNKMYTVCFQSGFAVLDKNTAPGIHMGISRPASKKQREAHVISLHVLVFKVLSAQNHPWAQVAYLGVVCYELCHV